MAAWQVFWLPVVPGTHSSRASAVATFPGTTAQWLPYRGNSDGGDRSQRRDRAGFAPASLLSEGHQSRAPSCVTRRCYLKRRPPFNAAPLRVAGRRGRFGCGPVAAPTRLRRPRRLFQQLRAPG